MLPRTKLNDRLNEVIEQMKSAGGKVPLGEVIKRCDAKVAGKPDRYFDIFSQKEAVVVREILQERLADVEQRRNQALSKPIEPVGVKIPVTGESEGAETGSEKTEGEDKPKVQ